MSRLACALALWLAGALGCAAGEGNQDMAKKTRSAASRKDPVRARVAAAFNAARSGEMGPSSDLQTLGKRLPPYLGPYLKDPSEDVRRQAVMLLKAAGGGDALPMLVRALGDPSRDVQERAAMALYENYTPKAVAACRTAGPALRKSIAGGNHLPAAALLLAYFPGAATEKTLRDLAGRDSADQTKLHPWAKMVPVSLPAHVALSRLGAAESRRALLDTIEKAGQPELEFLLAVIRDIDAPEVLHSLARTLDDQREVEQELPSGAALMPRLCDVAVNAFAARLKLKLSFETAQGRRYEPAQIDEVRRAIKAAIPQ